MSPAYIAGMIAHLSAWDRHGEEATAMGPRRAGDINTHVLGAIASLDELHKLLTGEFAPLPKRENCFEEDP